MGKSSREKQERKFLQRTEEKRNFNKPSLERLYLFIIEWGTYLALFTPLILAKDFFFPFVSPKTIFFRIIVDIIFIAYLLLVINNRKYLPKFNALNIAVTVFLGILVLTSFTGINFEKSFWSTFERMTGLLTFFHLFAFFIILTSVFKERKHWERILMVSILVGLLLSSYVLLSDDASTRGGGTLGNTSFMSAYLLFNIFFAIILLFTKSGYWKIFYGGALIIFLASLFFNQEPTRGAIVAFILGSIILLSGYVFFYLLSLNKKLLKKLVLAFIILIILGTIGFSQTSFLEEQINEVWQSNSIQSRLVVWNMALQGWQERLWLGWGLENFNVPFAKYFDPALPPTGDIWYDRVHNIVLDVLITSGILGLISYLAIFGTAIFGLLKICKKVTFKKNLLFPLGMIAILVSYFIQNIFVFDMVSSYMMFFLALGFISFLLNSGKVKEENLEDVIQEKNPALQLIAIIFIIFTLLTIYFGNIQPARTSLFIIEGISSPLSESITVFQKAIKTSPIAVFEAPEQFTRKLGGYIHNASQEKATLIRGFEISAEELKKAIDKNPQDFRYYLITGRHYNDFYQLDGKKEYLQEAIYFLEKAIELSPNNQQGYWSLAQTKFFQGKTDEVVELMQIAVDLEPRYSQSHWYLAMTHMSLGENELALEKIKDAENAGFKWRESLEELKKVIAIYQALQNDEELISLYLLAINMDPENAQFWAGLAVTYANLGQFAQAKEAVQKAIDLKPDFLPQLEEFLNSLP